MIKSEAHKQYCNQNFEQTVIDPGNYMHIRLEGSSDSSILYDGRGCGADLGSNSCKARNSCNSLAWLICVLVKPSLAECKRKELTRPTPRKSVSRTQPPQSKDSVTVRVFCANVQSTCSGGFFGMNVVHCVGCDEAGGTLRAGVGNGCLAASMALTCRVIGLETDAVQDEICCLQGWPEGPKKIESLFLQSLCSAMQVYVLAGLVELKGLQGVWGM